jgi:hypothetical protein
MPFKRKTLSELREENRQFIQAELKNVGALLRFGNSRLLLTWTPACLTCIMPT